MFDPAVVLPYTFFLEIRTRESHCGCNISKRTVSRNTDSCNLSRTLFRNDMITATVRDPECFQKNLNLKLTLTALNCANLI